MKYILPQHLRRRLTKPLGELIRGDLDQTVVELKKRIADYKVNDVISVGDVVTLSLLKGSIQPRISIVDYKSLRKPVRGRRDITTYYNLVVKVFNEAGTISEEAIRAVKSAFEIKAYTLIEVVGEEDLLAIPAVLYAPKNSIVVYGQPREGIVVIVVDESSKRLFKNIFSMFIKDLHDL